MQVPAGLSARVDVALVGSLTSTGGGVASTCTLVRDGDRTIVVDPGMAPSAGAILDPLASLGVRPEDVTDVVLSHHHPDHTLYAGLFPNAAVHDHWAIYRGSAWEDAEAEGRRISNSVSLIRVPGHTAQDIAAVASTSDGIVVLSHLWWDSDGPREDPYAENPKELHA